MRAAEASSRLNDASAGALDPLGRRVDVELLRFLDGERDAAASLDPDAVLLVDEIARLVRAGGKRIRPALCYWGHRAAGGADGRDIVLAAAALELLHTFALVHDDVMDGDDTRRGVAAVHEHAAAMARSRGAADDAARVGLSVAILAGDLAAVYADRLLLESGFAPDRLLEARRLYEAMRVRMATGQLLDVIAGPDADRELRGRISALKTGSYTIEGPLAIGATLAGGPPEVIDALARYARPLGRAFQARDDLLDREAAGHVVPDAADIDALVDEARAALDAAALPADAARALHDIAELVAVRGEDLAASPATTPRRRS